MYYKIVIEPLIGKKFSIPYYGYDPYEKVEKYRNSPQYRGAHHVKIELEEFNKIVRDQGNSPGLSL